MPMARMIRLRSALFGMGRQQWFGEGGEQAMDADTVLHALGGLLASRAAATSMLFASLLVLAGALVVWAKL